MTPRTRALLVAAPLLSLAACELDDAVVDESIAGETDGEALDPISDDGGGWGSGGGRIVFAREDPEPDLFVMNGNGTNPIKLPLGAAFDESVELNPSWRPDRRAIVFMSDLISATNPEGDFELFVVELPSFAVRQLTVNALDDEMPEYSPDGRQIAFARDLDPVIGQGDYDVLVMRADGSGERNLTRSPGIDDLLPAWSPDGARLAYSTNADGGGDLEIVTMRPDGSGRRQLTQNDGNDLDADWSPNGALIAFSSTRDASDAEPFQEEVYVMRTDGRSQRRLTNHPLGDFYPRWSPDGSRIAFSSFRTTVEEDWTLEVFSMRPDGTNLVNLTRNPAFDINPDW